MSDQQLNKLISEAQSLANDLRQRAADMLAQNRNLVDPFERGEAAGYATALAYSARQLEELLTGYSATKPLV